MFALERASPPAEDKERSSVEALRVLGAPEGGEAREEILLREGERPNAEEGSREGAEEGWLERISACESSRLSSAVVKGRGWTEKAGEGAPDVSPEKDLAADESEDGVRRTLAAAATAAARNFSSKRSLRSEVRRMVRSSRERKGREEVSIALSES